MAKTPEEKYRTLYRRLEHVVDGTIHDDAVAAELIVGGSSEKDIERLQEINPTDAKLILNLCDAYDPDNVTASPPSKPRKVAFNLHHRYKTKSSTTLSAWISRLRQVAYELELCIASVSDVNETIQMGIENKLNSQKKAWSNSTVRGVQSALRMFYWFYEDSPETNIADAEAIVIKRRNGDDGGKSFDPADMLTRDEIAQAEEAIDNPRDFALFNLLLGTGLANQAARNLRVRDVNLADRTYTYNTSMEGNKNRHEPNAPRSLGRATQPLREWKNSHPEWEPDAHILTVRKDYTTPDPYEPISDTTVSRALNRIKERAGIEKPMNPHMLRHNFVTWCKEDRDPPLPDNTVKWLIGHRPSSDVMETTYSHLSGDTHNQRLEEALGMREPEGEDRLRPEVCPTCSRPTRPGDRACTCGYTWDPSLQHSRHTIGKEARDELVETEDVEVREALAELEEWTEENPEIADLLINQVQSGG